jgi:hypothetical protein
MGAFLHDAEHRRHRRRVVGTTSVFSPVTAIALPDSLTKRADKLGQRQPSRRS